MATLLGTHNSGITIADGYGNRDEHFQQYFKWIRWVVSRMPSPCLLSPLLLQQGLTWLMNVHVW